MDIFVENRHDQNYLYSIISENKHQAPKTENRDRNIVKLPWIPIIRPKKRKELRKIGCKVIFTLAAKLKNKLCNNKIKLLPNSYPSVDVCSLDQLNTKKIAWKENGKRWVQLNIPKIVMGGLIWCTQKYLQNCPTYRNIK